MAVSVVDGRTPELGAWVEEVDGEPFGEWDLPGMGDAAPDCGEVSASAFCDTWEGWTEENDQREHIDYLRHQCGRRECPECWSSRWAGPQTVSAVSRLAAGRYTQPDGIDRRIIHAVVSPPEDSINTIKQYYDARKRAARLAAEHGIRGGLTISHGYRPLDGTRDRYTDENPELPLWRWIRTNEEPWRDQVEWSPHYHVIGLCRDFEAAEDRDDGWVLQNFSTGYGVKPNPGADRRFTPLDGPRDRDAIEDMVAAVRYLLSHATFPAEENRQATTWWGELSSRHFSPDPEKAADRETEPRHGPLSKGAWDLIQRVTEEIVGAGNDDDSEGGGEPDTECGVEGCGGRMHDIWDFPLFRESPAYRELPEEASDMIQTVYSLTTDTERPTSIEEARKRVTGDTKPPPSDLSQAERRERVESAAVGATRAEVHAAVDADEETVDHDLDRLLNAGKLYEGPDGRLRRV